jgi:hypothetical protein
MITAPVIHELRSPERLRLDQFEVDVRVAREEGFASAEDDGADEQAIFVDDRCAVTLAARVAPPTPIGPPLCTSLGSRFQIRANSSSCSGAVGFRSSAVSQ